jgi:hypothetical protein
MISPVHGGCGDRINSIMDVDRELLAAEPEDYHDIHDREPQSMECRNIWNGFGMPGGVFLLVWEFQTVHLLGPIYS